MKACPDQIAERLGASLTQLVLAWSLRNNTSQVDHYHHHHHQLHHCHICGAQHKPNTF